MKIHRKLVLVHFQFNFQKLFLHISLQSISYQDNTTIQPLCYQGPSRSKDHEYFRNYEKLDHLYSVSSTLQEYIQEIQQAITTGCLFQTNHVPALRILWLYDHLPDSLCEFKENSDNLYVLLRIPKSLTQIQPCFPTS